MRPLYLFSISLLCPCIIYLAKFELTCSVCFHRLNLFGVLKGRRLVGLLNTREVDTFNTGSYCCLCRDCVLSCCTIAFIYHFGGLTLGAAFFSLFLAYSLATYTGSVT